MDFSTELVYKMIFKCGNSLWVLLCTFMLNLFGFMIKYIHRFLSNGDSQKDNSICDSDHYQEHDQTFRNDSLDSLFQKCKDFKGSDEETDCSAFTRRGLTVNTSKYQFVAGKDVSGFIERAETMSFTVHELSGSSIEDLSSTYQSMDDPVSTHKDLQKVKQEAEVQNLSDSDNCFSAHHDQLLGFQEVVSEEEADNQEQTEDPVKNSINGGTSDQTEQATFVDHQVSRNEEMVIFEENFSDQKSNSYEFQLVPENNILSYKSNPESACSDDSHIDSVKAISISDEHVCQDMEEIVEEDLSLSDSNRYGVQISNDEYTELEPHLELNNGLEMYLYDSTELDRESNFLHGFFHDEDLHELDCKEMLAAEHFNSMNASEEPKSEKGLWDSDSDDDEDELDILWEQRELIEQMKMERKLARAKGLPTILEDCETQKMVEDLKPLEMNEKFEHKDQMEEIQKFYKSYAEKMRKLDILNYQTMNAISFLRLKDPIQLTNNQKHSISTIKSLLLPSFWPCKLRRIYANPTLKPISEMYRNLESVYVGQVCLSWEILYWQFGKTKELLEHDCKGYYSYSQVAAEIQQFQVLLHRFIEDEPFQEPRVQNYVKKRLIMGGFLQVPIIKDDSLKDKKEGIDKEENTISIAMLADILEEAMQVFWKFLRADKNETSLMIKSPWKSQFDLQDHADSEFLMEIRTSLHKKEKRLKDTVRSGNCIVKKFQKHEGAPLDYETFVTQVELRLVSRVLSLSRLTRDQLLWCQKKLSNIKFVKRKFRVEPSFLLFPY